MADFFYKLLAIVAFIAGGIIFILKKQNDKSRSDEKTQNKFKSVDDAFSEHLKRFDDVDKSQGQLDVKIERIIEQLYDMKVMKIEIMQLQKENVELKGQNVEVLKKLNSIFEKMSLIEINMQNKANRP